MKVGLEKRKGKGEKRRKGGREGDNERQEMKLNYIVVFYFNTMEQNSRARKDLVVLSQSVDTRAHRAANGIHHH